MAENNSPLLRFVQALSNNSANSEAVSPPAGQITGQLVRPIRQEIGDDCFYWDWEPIGEIGVSALYFKADHRWRVDIYFHGEIAELSSDDAKKLAETLLSAYNWEQAWKPAFADYFLNDQDLTAVAGEITEEVTEETFDV